MYPIIQQLKAPKLEKSTVEKAPYFEILLFRSVLRFKNPPCNLALKADLFGNKGTDKRPFVNTASKSGYLCDEDIGLWYETFYATGWQFFPKGWFKPAYATLNLWVTGLAVVPTEQAQFSDLMNLSTARAWIAHYYRRRQQMYEEMSLSKRGDDFELTFTRSAQALENASRDELPVESLVINGLPVFKVRPAPNKVDFLIAFSREDMVQLSFRLSAVRSLPLADKQYFQEQASAWVDAIVQSVELDLDACKLTSSVPV